MFPPTPILFNVVNIKYAFCEKLRHLENELLLKITSLSFMTIGCLKEVN
jgi:hypothetical protein